MMQELEPQQSSSPPSEVLKSVKLVRVADDPNRVDIDILFGIPKQLLPCKIALYKVDLLVHNITICLFMI